MKKSPLLPIFLIVAVDVLGLTLILPLLPFYAEKMGATPTEVGLLVSVYAACQFVAGPLLGQMSDRTGRKPLLLVSQFGTLIGFLILAYAQVLWVVFVSRIIDGLTAGNLSLAQAYIADVTEPENRSKSFAVIGVSFGIGFLIGPAISGYLSTFGYQYPIFAAAALSATSILATYFLAADSYAGRRRGLPPVARPRLGSLRRVLQAPRPRAPSLAIFSVRIRLRVVHVRLRSVRRKALHLAGQSLRPTRGGIRFPPMWACSESFCKAVSSAGWSNASASRSWSLSVSPAAPSGSAFSVSPTNFPACWLPLRFPHSPWDR